MIRAAFGGMVHRVKKYIQVNEMHFFNE